MPTTAPAPSPVAEHLMSSSLRARARASAIAPADTAHSTKSYPIEHWHDSMPSSHSAVQRSNTSSHVQTTYRDGEHNCTHAVLPTPRNRHRDKLFWAEPLRAVDAQSTLTRAARFSSASRTHCRAYSGAHRTAAAQKRTQTTTRVQIARLDTPTSSLP